MAPKGVFVGGGSSIGAGLLAEVAAPPPPRSAAPLVPGLIFPRDDTPFQGEGTRVVIRSEPGYTRHGKLTVPFRFQLPPINDVARTSAFSWPTFDTFDENGIAGERSRPGGRRLRTLPLSSMFVFRPLSYEVWATKHTHDPVLACKQLEAFCEQGLKFRLRVFQHQFAHDDVDMIATLLSITITEKVSEPDTRYVDMTFQEYDPTQLERNAVHNEIGPWTHTVKKGDTLYKLAKHYYKRQSYWRRIADAKQNGNLEHHPPSGDLLPWAKKHHRKTIVIPQSPNAHVAVAG